MFTLAVLLATLASAYTLPAFTHSFSIPKIIGRNEWNPSSSFTHGDIQNRAESDSAGSNSLPPIYTQCTTPDTVALTSDDGPYDFMYNISDTLTANGAKGTFFVNGYNYQCIYSDENIKRLRYIVRHQIASHTWSHPHLKDASPYWTLFTASLNDDQVREELSKIDEAILRITALVIWSYDSGDSKPNARSPSGVREQRSVYDSCVNGKKTIGIFLNHEVYGTTAHELVPCAVAKLKAAGYKMVTLAECLGLDAYRGPPVPPSNKDHTWKY
ncbi:carbohydrate esterase family 4 protein [Hydnum rufescens UP504]|uniref:Carbohydrate esterase family 4 protein n=1 Tax=Hydnum rufescens UP504 TaxID=1448309 RepID=A0A9P6DSP2_9AGAM|nr:carbohydrate esterase family 4 protein [Hydnum rufescens UP504]